MEVITSRQNQHFKGLMKLRKRETSQYLVEGEREMSHVHEIDILYYAKWTPFVEEMSKKAKECIAISEELLERIACRESQAVAVCTEKKSSFEELRNKSLLLACEGIEKPGNLGGMLRTAEAAGVEGVIVADPVVDLFNANVVRASLGALFCLPVVQSSTAEALQFLHEEGMQIIVATPHAKQMYYGIDFCKPTCIVIGSEATGVSPPWLEAISVKIPMLGKIDALNASISASILLYEVVRQRNSLS